MGASATAAVCVLFHVQCSLHSAVRMVTISGHLPTCLRPSGSAGYLLHVFPHLGLQLSHPLRLTLCTITSPAFLSTCPPFAVAVVPPGSYMPTPPLVALCPRGTWKDWVGPDTSCTSCAAGVTTPAEGATSPLNCSSEWMSVWLLLVYRLSTHMCWLLTSMSEVDGGTNACAVGLAGLLVL